MKLETFTLRIAMVTIPVVGILLMLAIVLQSIHLLVASILTAITGVLTVFLLLVVEEIVKILEKESKKTN